MKVVLKIPPPKAIKQYLMDLPVNIKDKVESLLSSDEKMGNTKKALSTFLVKLKNLISGNGFTDKADSDFSEIARQQYLLAYGKSPKRF